MGLTFAGDEFGTRLVVDVFLAWSFGVVFQYFTIVPMRGLSIGRGIFEAIRADTLSIVAFEMGLFGWVTTAAQAERLKRIVEIEAPQMRLMRGAARQRAAPG